MQRSAVRTQAVETQTPGHSLKKQARQAVFETEGFSWQKSLAGEYITDPALLGEWKKAKEDRDAAIAFYSLKKVRILEVEKALADTDGKARDSLLAELGKLRLDIEMMPGRIRALAVNYGVCELKRIFHEIVRFSSESDQLFDRVKVVADQQRALEKEKDRIVRRTSLDGYKSETAEVSKVMECLIALDVEKLPMEKVMESARVLVSMLKTRVENTFHGAKWDAPGSWPNGAMTYAEKVVRALI